MEDHTGKTLISPLDFKTDTEITATLTQRVNAAQNAHEAEAWLTL